MKKLMYGMIIFSVWSFNKTNAQQFIDYESPPVQYSKEKPDNEIENLRNRLDSKESKLVYESRHGFLKSLLKELNISETSQVLVFSKSSLQTHHIGPKNPRAIFFNDTTFVGYLHGTIGMIEIAIADKNRGMSFYTLDQSKNEIPEIQLQINQCMTCHGGTRSLGVPGLIVRSVFTDEEGRVLFSAGGNLGENSNPLEKRWGGWYVTGRSGIQQHLGNFVLKDKKRPSKIDNFMGINLTQLDSFFASGEYPQPTSDIVALMVMEHQLNVLNYITRLVFESKIATVTKDFSHIDNAVENLVKQLLFSSELPLKNPIEGGEAFKMHFENFTSNNNFSKSLRILDLKKRIFKHPISFMICSDAYKGLPADVREKVQKKILMITSSDETIEGYEHLDVSNKKFIREILSSTSFQKN